MSSYDETQAADTGQVPAATVALPRQREARQPLQSAQQRSAC